MAIIHQTPKHRPFDKQDKIVMIGALVTVVVAVVFHLF